MCPQLQLLRQPNMVLLALEVSLEPPGHSQEELLHGLALDCLPSFQLAVLEAWELVASHPSLTEGPWGPWDTKVGLAWGNLVAGRGSEPPGTPDLRPHQRWCYCLVENVNPSVTPLRPSPLPPSSPPHPGRGRAGPGPGRPWEPTGQGKQESWKPHNPRTRRAPIPPLQRPAPSHPGAPPYTHLYTVSISRGTWCYVHAGASSSFWEEGGGKGCPAPPRGPSSLRGSSEDGADTSGTVPPLPTHWVQLVPMHLKPQTWIRPHGSCLPSPRRGPLPTHQ